MLPTYPLLSFLQQTLLVSRPAFWFISVWLYLVPCSGDILLLSSSLPFWVGLGYVTYPLNLLVFSWNDLNDTDLDRGNPRKGIPFLGSNCYLDQELLRVRNTAVGVNLVFFAGLVVGDILSWRAALVSFGAVVGFNYLYNDRGGPCWRSGPPPFDLIGSLGYLCVITFSAQINEREDVSIPTYLFHLCMILRSQLWGQVIDFECDKQFRRQTTAVHLGLRNARVLLSSLVFLELLIATLLIEDFYLVAFSALCFLQSFIEVVFYPAENPPNHLALLTALVMTPPAFFLCLRVAFYPTFS